MIPTVANDVSLVNTRESDAAPGSVGLPKSDAASRTVSVQEWRRAALPLGLGLLLLGGVFNKEVMAAVQTWQASTAYNHCFLIIPIVLYLVWDRRVDLVGTAPRPTPAALWLGLPVGLAWLMSERLGIMEGRQLVAISFAELLFLSIMGKRLWWALAGPLLYLYFLVPFGEFLTPRLQDFSTWFVRHGLDFLGVAAYIDGYIIEIPQGTFFVAEACAGLRFLIASFAFGCLYALIIYRSPMRRVLFILVSLIVPIIANGFRALGIVYLGYLLNSAQAAAADHLIYGWVFFSVVILLLIAVGLPFRQDDVSTRSATPTPLPVGPPFTMGGMLAVTLGMVVAAAISPTLATALTIATVGEAPAPTAIDLGGDCVARVETSNGSVRSRDTMQRVVCDGVAMDVQRVAFPPRITAGPLMAERRRLVVRAETEGLQENWLETADGASTAWRIMATGSPPFVIAVSIWLDGKPIKPGLAMRAKMAMNSLLGSDFAPTIVTLTPAVDWEALSKADRAKAEASVPAFLLSHRDLDQIVGSSSRR